MKAVITGASSGIGAALARELHAAGWQVTLVARREAQLRALAAELGSRCRVVVQDVSAGCEWIEREGEIDLLVNNAGIQTVGWFPESNAAADARVLDVDLAAPIALARRVAPRMVARRAGMIVNVSSVAALTPPPGMAVYAAAKAGLGAFSEALATELEGSGVGVLTVYPGPIENGSPQEAYDVYGRQSVAGKMPSASAAALARAMRRAIERRKRRLIFPRFYMLTWWLSAFARWVVSRGTPKVRPAELPHPSPGLRPPSPAGRGE
ncbi:MAG TPA: SDR family NAD(P)-dependent oxidoreductase [Dongiaceae bacterium]|nr:SDR family NAD(P)-dependent oxidoreductase [Dongiaceae bacterium]